MSRDQSLGLEDCRETYVNFLWEKRFKHLAKVPKDIENQIEQRKTAFERHRELQDSAKQLEPSKNNVLTEYKGQGSEKSAASSLVSQVYGEDDLFSSSLAERQNRRLALQPSWHAPWKLMRVLNGHNGWVRCVCVDPVDNEWFATGSNDTTVKVWDLATGRLKLTLSGHVMTVRSIAVSTRHPFMFTASEDKLVKCWDLEKNTAIKDFHGHYSGVNTVDVHPTLDLIASAGRDAVVRLWDIRTRQPVMTLAGHKGPINQVKCFPVDPQIVSCSTDATVRMWDIRAGKAAKILTHHSKNIRSIGAHPAESSLATCSTNDVRSWRCHDGQLLTNFQSDDLGIINCLTVNQDGILFAGTDDGRLSFFDYKTGHKYQDMPTTKIPGSLDSERGILSASFDQTGLRLITGESDKSIKIWRQVDEASPETHPGLSWNPNINSQRF
ncbi:LANO_0H15698g1_1 [Lachancea nothofagi CBS 11611]|uniref:Pre-mRNA-splicing factor PRP46 n=1 Tax=Lachancea nothofagi CBS 11611 TaxID=1266666 RepID=A0A1G4KMP3_9SACH|nr:LANO_0H15698g1_1 [Lachancea nothofagi CBS 11611]